MKKEHLKTSIIKFTCTPSRGKNSKWYSTPKTRLKNNLTINFSKSLTESSTYIVSRK